MLKLLNLPSYVRAVLGAIILALGTLFAVKRSSSKSEKIEDLENYVETDKEVSNVEATPNKPAAIKRMRDNGLIR